LKPPNPHSASHWGRLRGSIPNKEARFTTTRNLSQIRLDQDILVVSKSDSGVLYLYRTARAFGFTVVGWIIVLYPVMS
jgi:hypothetical protein